MGIIEGNVSPKQNYVTNDGFPLGTRLYYATTKKKLSLEEREELDSIGVDLQRDYFKGLLSWGDWIKELRKYKENVGDVAPNSTYVTKDGKPLGKWLRDTITKRKLTLEQKKASFYWC